MTTAADKPETSPARENGSHPRKVTHESAARVRSIREAEGGGQPSAEITVIVAGMSKNQTNYPADVLAVGTPKYDGAKSVLDHPGWFSDYSMRNLAGIIKNPKYDTETQSIKATFYFTDTEAGQMLLALARQEVRMRDNGTLTEDDRLFGFSHVAYVKGEEVENPEDPDDPESPVNYEYTVKEIVEVISVDAVVFPAAGGQVEQMGESLIRNLQALESSRLAGRKESQMSDKPDNKKKDETPAETPTSVGEAVTRIEQITSRHASEMQEKDGKILALETANEALRTENEELKAKYEAEEAAKKIEAAFDAKAIPEAARVRLRKGIEGMSLEHALRTIDLTAESMGLKPKKAADKPAPVQTEARRDDDDEDEGEDEGDEDVSTAQSESTRLNPREVAERDGKAMARGLLGRPLVKDKKPAAN